MFVKTLAKYSRIFASDVSASPKDVLEYSHMAYTGNKNTDTTVSAVLALMLSSHVRSPLCNGS